MGERMIPARIVVNRMVNHREFLREEIRNLPWWSWKRRLILRGALATYHVEQSEAHMLCWGDHVALGYEDHRPSTLFIADHFAKDVYK